MKMNEPMGRHTTLGFGGPADVFAIVADRDAMARLLQTACEHGVTVMPVGGGSNLVVRDGGIEGVVAAIGFERAIERVDEDSERVHLRVGAGMKLGGLLNYLADNGYSGLEGLGGIPGELGGAIAGNAGSRGAEIKDVLIEAEVMDRDGEVRTISREDMGFAYRSSALPAGSIILGARIVLMKADAREVSERLKNAIDKKKATQPVRERSAGCVYKNPEGASAGALIDQAGCKGMAEGGIEVSGLHANFFINRGHGTAGDFARLMDRVSARVRDAFGITLTPEIRMVGRC